MNMIEAIRSALDVMMQRDPSVVIFGEGVQPVERPIDLYVAEAGLDQLAAEFVLIRFRVLFGVDVGLE